MDRTQFTFYESFFKAVSRIKKKADRAEAYDAICAYALYGTEPEMDTLSDSAAIAFELSKPNLDASRRKANSGKKGGEHKQAVSKTEANDKQNESKPEQTESKKENKKEKEKEKEIENKCYNPLTPEQESLFSPELLAAVKDWLTYKHERREDYKPTGLKAMTTEIRNNAATYGEAAVIALIRVCMAQNYKGITWDKLQQKQAQKVATRVSELGNPIRTQETIKENAEIMRRMRERYEREKNSNREGG